MKKNIEQKLFVFISAALLATPNLLKCQSDWAIVPSSNATITTGSDLLSDFAEGISLDGRGNSYVVGNFTGGAHFSSSYNFANVAGTDIFLEKVDHSGNIIWACQGTGALNNDAKSVAVSPDGGGGVNIYVTGYFRGSVTFTSANSATTQTIFAASGGNDQDMFIAKYLDNGDIEWAMDCGSSTGGNLTVGLDIAVGLNGTTPNIWVVGSFTGTVAFSGTISLTSLGSQNGYIANYTDGTVAPAGANWAEGMRTSSGSSGLMQALGVDIDNSGNAYACGYWRYGANGDFGGAYTSVVPDGSDDSWVASYDGTGAIGALAHWGPTAGNTGNSARGICCDGNGSVYITGGFTGANTAFPGSNTLTSNGGVDGYLIGMDNTFTTVSFLDLISGSTNGDDYGNRVVVDNCGQRCYVTGLFRGTEDFAGNTITLSSVGGADAFAADFDAGNGTALNAVDLGGTTYDDVGYDIGINSVEDVQFCGSFAANAPGYTPVAYTLNNAAVSVADGFVSRWDDSGWPALESTEQAITQGIDVKDCEDYSVGDMVGVGVTFGNLTPINSSKDLTNTYYSSDIYFLDCNKYATFENFVRLTSGTANETSKDMVNNGITNNHYVVGNAALATNYNTITFVGDPTDSYTMTSNLASNAFAIKTDNSGAVVWAASVRPNNAGGAVTGEGIAVDVSGNVYMCGWFSGQIKLYNAGGSSYATTPTATGTDDIFVVKYNSSGTVQWLKTYGTAGNIAKALGISIDPLSTYYYLTGSINSNVTLVHAHTLVGTTDGFAVRGELGSIGAWDNDAYWGTTGKSDKGNDIYSNGIDEVYVTGIGASTSQVYIASFDLTGTTAGVNNWTFNSSFTGSATATGNDILLGSFGMLYVSGMLNVPSASSVSFGSLSPSLTSSGAYLVGLTSWNGIPFWESTVYTRALSCNALAYDNSYLSTDLGDVNLFGGNVTGTGGGSPAYLHKATAQGLEISARYGHFISDDYNHANKMPTSVTSMIYPNPFDNTATLALSASIDPTLSPLTFIVFDLTGQPVKRIDEITSTETSVSSDDLAAGIYFYEVVQSGNIVSTGKMIINK